MFSKPTFQVSAGILILISLFSFTGNELAKDKVAKDYHANLDTFLEATVSFESSCDKLLAGGKSPIEIQSEFARLRRVFKKTEPIYAYLDPEYVKDHINPAPLYKHERNAPKVVVLSPKGLQRMEELVYDDLTDAEIQEDLYKLAEILHARFSRSIRYQKSVPITDRMIFEAARDHLVRIMTLNVTGFDTPAGNNTLEEAKLALEACEAIVHPYYPRLTNELKDSLKAGFDRGYRQFEKQNDFDSFDRVEFLKETINPLYQYVRDIHYYLRYETKYEIDVLPSALNYDANNLFANDFLDQDYYGGFYRGETLEQQKELGKYLFFDPVLSANNERACASCHKPELAFTDGQKKSLAMGFDGTVSRNSPSLINALYAEKYFYDLRADRLANQMEHVVHSSKEFDTDFIKMAEKLKTSEEYTELFVGAFPKLKDEPITKHTIATAMAAYVSSLTGFNSEFDKFIRNESTDLSKEAYDGFNIFMGKAACGTCHFAPVFNGLVPPYYEESESEVLGVLVVPGDSGKVQMDDDLGRSHSNRLADESWVYKHSFKTTSVRNSALTAPYMHNGAFPDLESVVDFYNQGGGIGHGLDVPNQTLPPDPLGLTDYEKKALVSFMEALTDTTGMTSKPGRLPKFESEPDLEARVIGGEY